MQRRSCSDLGDHRSAARGSGNPAAPRGFQRLLEFERLDELVKETRNSVGQILTGHFRRKAFGDLEPAPLDQVSLVRGKEFVEHLASLRLRWRSLCMPPYIEVECQRADTRVKR